ncbi:SIR2 family protein [Candidatus Magnetominusculus xianensis]|uniref:SIR2 family protein n=1 Tax=Candidatus Magnetominusculus xianensis TaxID=1748249 RepID=UPI0019EE1337|nr:SIR2 family protein [Candidatus Magnetominusculus xianensis]MBF0404562.1 SIR2 family protein [Nitrospirota bacterium]
MSDEILFKPNVPKEIKESVNNGTLAVFIGAGVSSIVGCERWDQLANSLVKKCYDKGFINFKESEELSKIQDHKKTISICYHIMNGSNKIDIFYDIMKNSLKEDEDIAIPNIYDDIYKLRGLFITTNADTHFDRLFNTPNILYQRQNFKYNKIDQTNLYHIHGSIRETDSLIFTVASYMERYNDSDFGTFLQRIFREYTVLFIGYGLGEFEILDFLLRKDKNNKIKSPPRHFMLYPLYTGQENILKYMQSYYSDLRINICAYAIDKKGYRQLEDVIKHWNKEINQITDFLPKSFEQLDAVMQTKSKTKIMRTLQKIKNDKSLEDYFFKILAVDRKPIKWLIPLKGAGYFNPNNNPKPQEVHNKKGYYTVPSWNILDALKNMSLRNEENPLEEVTEILIEIVNGIISYRVDGKRIDNYKTDSKILEIISHIPISYINKNHIDFIKDAIYSNFATSLMDRVICELFLPKLIHEKNIDLIIELLKVIFLYRELDISGDRRCISGMDIYYLKQTIDKNKSGIASLCPVDAVRVGLEKVKEILTKYNGRFSFIWIPTIEDHPQTRFPDKYECQLVHFIRDMLESSQPKEIEAIVNDMLKSKHDIMKRLAYHTIRHHYKNLSHLLWNIEGNPLSPLTMHELYELLKSRCKDFSQQQINLLLGWIDSMELYVPDEIKENHEKRASYEAYYKKEWLLSLDSANPDVKKKYDEYHAINDASYDHP